MAICSHCGRQSQDNAHICQFCGYPLTTQQDDISAQDTVFTSSPGAEGQNSAGANIAQAQSNGALAKVVVRPLQGLGEQPREYALTGQNISIGRSPSCEIVLENDQLTSRRHALLRFDGTRYTVVDLGSSNGTFVNDAEIRDATALNSGDRIIVGEHELMFTTQVSGATPVASVDLNGAPPSSPLGVTGSQPAVNLNQMQTQQADAAQVPSEVGNADEADTTYMATVMAPMESASGAAADMSDAPPAADTVAAANVPDVTLMETVPDVSAVAPDLFAVADIAPVAGATDAAEASDVSDVSDVTDVTDVAEPMDASAEASAPASDEVEPLSSGTLPPPSTPDNTPLLARAPSSGALRQPGGELDQLRAQLAQLAATSEAVAQHAAEETDLSEQRRQALAETRDQLHAILAGIQNASAQSAGSENDETGDLTDLIELTQQAAADPNHLQHVSRLAEHASEITKALEALQARRLQPPRPAADENALAELRALQARLDELA